MIYNKKKFMGLFLVIVLFTFPNCADTKKDVTVSTLLDNKRNTPEIKLFIYRSCPYCQRVINFLKSSNQEHKVQILDASQPAILEELRKLNNNNTQCPFLYDPEKNIKMLESLDIIEYLKKHLTK
ncbi:glutathione S-transferase N-terminal domain-containing protein [Candidatus Dependentiae bacterium]|nr:glutathione S-transferase N-terminal domain-containing protein [Candidatus Dependentiae bacterium]